MRLKLEPIKNDQLSLTFKDRTRLWSWDFSLTLAAALMVHLLAIFIFSIDLGPLPSLAPSSQKVCAQAMGPRIDASLLLEKERAPLKLPPIPRSQVSFSSSPPPSLIQSSPSPYFPTSYSPSLELLDALTAKNGTPQIFFSRGYAILSAPSIFWEQLPPFQAHLHFQASGKSGAIIWLNWIQTTGNKELDGTIENFLKQIRLKVPQEQSIAKGEVEIYL